MKATSKTLQLTGSEIAVKAFIRFGILPLFLIVSIALFAYLAPRFLTVGNLLNVARQSTYLVIVSLGQMLVLMTAGLDLSVGSTIALVSVVTAITMGMILSVDATAIWLAISLGIGAGLATGVVAGVINGVGSAVLKVTPFMMTLGMLSINFGLALTLSGGSPVYGMPQQFGEVFGYGKIFSVPVPIFVTAIVFLGVYIFLNRTAAGRYLYAIGSNPKAAYLSGIHTLKWLFVAYAICGLLSGVVGVLLTARVQSGEANMGQEFVLQSIAACIIGGVSLFGGVGRVGNVVLGAVFITLLSNGMSMANVDAYLQQVVLGVVLISAIVVDQLREKYTGAKR